MSTTMLGVFKNYDVYTCLPANSELLGKKKSFRMAVERLVNALNTYTENNSAKVVKILVDNIREDIERNHYTYFDIGGSTVGEKETYIYVLKFTWDPFHSIDIKVVKTVPISSIGLYTGCVRWENNDFHATYPVEFSDDITCNPWLNCECINKAGGCFYDLNEHLFHVFADSYYIYKESLLYLGFEHKEDAISGPTTIVTAFEKASELLSNYPEGINYNDSKECSKTDWFYNTLESVFKGLDKKNNFDSTDFYLAMCNYVKELGESKYKDKITINAN